MNMLRLSSSVLGETLCERLLRSCFIVQYPLRWSFVMDNAIKSFNDAYILRFK